MRYSERYFPTEPDPVEHQDSNCCGGWDRSDVLFGLGLLAVAGAIMLGSVLAVMYL